MKAVSEIGETAEYVAQEFEATCLGAPFKIILHDSVTVTRDEASGEILDFEIPDVPQLLIVVLLSRLTFPRKLSGRDIKFVRKVLGLKQAALAKHLDVTPEHLSRCETGATPMSPQGDKLLRVFAVKELCGLPEVPDCEKKEKLEKSLNSIFYSMKIESAHAAEDVLTLDFYRPAVDDLSNDAPPNSGWLDSDEKLSA